jgi:hypothetical protein
MAVRLLIAGHTKLNGRSYFAETVAIGTTSDAVILPTVQGRTRADDRISVMCIPQGGTGKIQYTMSPPEAVAAESGVVWADWTPGDIADGNTGAYTINGPVTALRCVSAVGTTQWLVVK